jgi:hypothetical protein
LGVDDDVYEELLNKMVKNLGNFKASGSPRKTPKEEEASEDDANSVLLCALFWLRKYCTQTEAMDLFGVHGRDFARKVRLGIHCLADSLEKEKELKWPSDDEFELQKNNWNGVLPDGLKDCVCVVDGSEWRISRPTKKEEEFYSPKKKQHSLNVLFIVWLNGVIFYKSPVSKGAQDQRDWNKYSLREKFIDKPYGVIGDGGFYFNRKKDRKTIISAKPFKAQNGKKLTPDEKKYNKQLSQYRVVVENSIGQLKKWAVFR